MTELHGIVGLADPLGHFLELESAFLRQTLVGTESKVDRLVVLHRIADSRASASVASSWARNATGRVASAASRAVSPAIVAATAWRASSMVVNDCVITTERSLAKGNSMQNSARFAIAVLALQVTPIVRTWGWLARRWSAASRASDVVPDREMMKAATVPPRGTVEAGERKASEVGIALAVMPVVSMKQWAAACAM